MKSEEGVALSFTSNHCLRQNTIDVYMYIRAARLRWFGHVVGMPEERISNYLLHLVRRQAEGQEAILAKTG